MIILPRGHPRWWQIRSAKYLELVPENTLKGLDSLIVKGDNSKITAKLVQVERKSKFICISETQPKFDKVNVSDFKGETIRKGIKKRFNAVAASNRKNETFN
jgi:hypothetical protein